MGVEDVGGAGYENRTSAVPVFVESDEFVNFAPMLVVSEIIMPCDCAAVLLTWSALLAKMEMIVVLSFLFWIRE